VRMKESNVIERDNYEPPLHHPSSSGRGVPYVVPVSGRACVGSSLCRAVPMSCRACVGPCLCRAVLVSGRACVGPCLCRVVKCEFSFKSCEVNDGDDD
jgi:hypothetical protein